MLDLVRRGHAPAAGDSGPAGTAKKDCASQVKGLRRTITAAALDGGCVSRQHRLAGAPVESKPEDFLTDIATRYYLRADSQVEIARDLGLDPSTVSRYLKRARDEGVVHVEIRPPTREDLELGRQVAVQRGLGRVVVAPIEAGDGSGDGALAATAARFVEGLLRNGMRLGISWGRTLAATIQDLHAGAVTGLRLAQIAGGVADPTPGIQGHDLVRRMAELYPGSTVDYLHAPAIVGSTETAAALVGDRTIQSALAAARRCELALVGIGQMDEGSTLYRGGHVDPADWAVLLAAGAAGNINTCFFDRAGRPIETLRARTIAVTLEELRAIATVVAVAGGSGKAGAIAGAIATGAIDILVTDEATAMELLAPDIDGDGQ